jgi:4-amino-4-deoxy-L-arabinose transferase-like glycosyltransferase
MRNGGAKHRAMANHQERLSISRQQVILAAITLAAAILRLTHLGAESFWIDEVSQAKTASLIGEYGLRTVAVRDNVSPLSHVILWVLQGMFGYSEAVARLPSAIAGILLVPVTYSLGRRLVSDRVGLIAALLVAINPYGLWYSRDARMYSLLSLWCAVYLLCLLNLLRDPGRRSTIVLALVSCIGLYIHEYFIFALVGSIGYVLVTRFRSNRLLVYRLLLVGGTALAAFVPWILAMLSYNAFAGIAGVARSGILFFAPYTLLTFLIGFNFGPSVREMHIEGAATAMRHELGLLAVPVLALVVVASALFFSLQARIRSRKPENDGIYLLTIFTAVMIIGPVLIAAAQSHINFNVRYCAGALAPAIILCVIAIDDMRHRNFARILAAVLVVIMLVASYRVLWPGTRYAREDLRGLSHYLSSRTVAGPLLVESTTVVGGLRWYGFNGQLTAVKNPFDSSVSAAVNGSYVNGDEVSVVQAREWETDPKNAVIGRLLSAGFKLDSNREFAGAAVSHFVHSKSH